MVTVDPSQLDRLLEIQVHDTALDRLRRRREQLPQRAELDELAVRGGELEAEIAALSSQIAEVEALEGRLDHEAQAVAERAGDVERTLYSGTIASPRELQDLQADLDQLKNQQRHLEDRELEAMERREGMEALGAELKDRGASLAADQAAVSAALAGTEAEIDAEVKQERESRDELAAGVDGALLADYEARRARNRGIGIARLVGGSCAACGLAVSAVEADRIRRADPGTVCSPEECECILVPR